MCVNIASNDSYRNKAKNVPTWKVYLLMNILKKTVKVGKILRMLAGVLLPVTDFQNFFTMKWNVVLTLAYNKRSCVDLTLLFCCDCQEKDWKAV